MTDPQIICTDRPANQQPPYPKLTNYGGCRPCEYFGVEIDPNGQRYSPPHYNVMSYGSSNYDYLTSCAKIFTNDQSVEMHYWINHVNRSYAKGSVYNLFDRRLTTNLTLNSHHRYVVQNVVVNNDSKLDIDHCLETNIKYNFEVPLGSTLEIR